MKKILGLILSLVASVAIAAQPVVIVDKNGNPVSVTGSSLNTTATATGTFTCSTCAQDSTLSSFKTANHTDTTAINTTLGSPFQAGGNIGNTAFGVTGNVNVQGLGTAGSPAGGVLTVQNATNTPVSVTVNTPPNDTLTGPTNVTGATDVIVNSQGSGAAALQITGTFTGLSGIIRGSVDGVNYVNIGAYNANTGAIITPSTTITSGGLFVIPAAGYRDIEYHVTAVSTGTAVVNLNSSAGALDPPNSVATSGGKAVNATNFPATVDINTGTPSSSTIRIVEAASTHAQCAALCANLVVKASAGILKSFEVSADSTINTSTWYVLIYDATSAPSDGAVTPAKCYQNPPGSVQMGGTLNGDNFTTGITIGVSTTGCFTKTATTHAYIGASYQ